MWTFDRKGWSKIIRISRLCFSAQLLRSSFRLVNLKSFPHQTLFWQPPPSSYLHFPFPMELSLVKVNTICQTYIFPPRNAVSNLPELEKHLALLAAIYYRQEDATPFFKTWLKTNSDWCAIQFFFWQYKTFCFHFPGSNIQFVKICFVLFCIRLDLRMSLFAFGLSFGLINLEINLIHWSNGINQKLVACWPKGHQVPNVHKI